MHKDIHQNDIGTVFEITLIDSLTGAVVDLTGFTLIEIRFKKPGEVVITRTASIPSGVPDTDGKIQYVTIANDLDVTGLWELRAKITLPTGTWTSEKDEFIVNEIF